MPNLRQSATDFIKAHNPQNLSEIMPSAGDLINNLKLVPKLGLNPAMLESVGIKELMGVLQQIQKNFLGDLVQKLLKLQAAGAILNPEQLLQISEFYKIENQLKSLASVAVDEIKDIKSQISEQLKNIQ